MICSIDQFDPSFLNYADRLAVASWLLSKMPKEHAMKQLYPDLWRTAPEHPLSDDLPDLMMHAYLLVREQGICCSADPSMRPTINRSGTWAGSRTST
jgi:hypothetical protein